MTITAATLAAIVVRDSNLSTPKVVNEGLTGLSRRMAS